MSEVYPSRRASVASSHVLGSEASATSFINPESGHSAVVNLESLAWKEVMAPPKKESVFVSRLALLKQRASSWRSKAGKASEFSVWLQSEVYYDPRVRYTVSALLCLVVILIRLLSDFEHVWRVLVVLAIDITSWHWSNLLFKKLLHLSKRFDQRYSKLIYAIKTQERSVVNVAWLMTHTLVFYIVLDPKQVVWLTPDVTLVLIRLQLCIIIFIVTRIIAMIFIESLASSFFEKEFFEKIHAVNLQESQLFTLSGPRRKQKKAKAKKLQAVGKMTMSLASQKGPIQSSSNTDLPNMVPSDDNQRDSVSLAWNGSTSDLASSDPVVKRSRTSIDNPALRVVSFSDTHQGPGMPSSSIDRMDSKLSDDLLSESVWAAGEDPEGDITKGPSMNRGAVEKIKRKRLRDMEEEELVDLALVIFDNVREKRKFILVTDLNRFFGDDESMEVFKMIDQKGFGMVTKPDIEATIRDVQAASISHFRTMDDSKVVVQAVGRIIKGVLYVLDLFIILIIFNSNVSGMWISMSSGMAISFIAFGSYIRAMLDAVILLFYIRPFAVGDIVQISDTIDGIQDSVDSYLEVVGLGLYTTRFERNDGRYMIFTNAKLVQMCINNVSRSKVLEKTVKFELDAGFSKVELSKLEQHVRALLLSDPTEYSSKFQVDMQHLSSPFKTNVCVRYWLAHNGADAVRVLRSHSRMVMCVSKSLYCGDFQACFSDTNGRLMYMSNAEQEKQHLEKMASGMGVGRSSSRVEDWPSEPLDSLGENDAVIKSPQLTHHVGQFSKRLPSRKVSCASAATSDTSRNLRGGTLVLYGPLEP